MRQTKDFRRPCTSWYSPGSSEIVEAITGESALLRAGIVGATGVVGQQFIVALQDHPWFQITALAASERSAGRPYGEAITDAKTGARRWYADQEPNEQVLSLPVELPNALVGRVDVVFSAVDSDEAKVLEPEFARTVPVVSTASAFRMEPDVPMIIPGVNDDHLQLIDRQQKNRGWKGYIVPQPNCTTLGLATTLKPLYERFGLQLVIMTSMQALSGAGRSPGVSGMDALDNVIPFIPNEEEKVQSETQKILGKVNGQGIEPAAFPVSCTCTRVNVMDGHTEAVFASANEPVSIEAARRALAEFDGGLSSANLPSAPGRSILVRDEPDRPQPRLDRNADNGMATVVGRLRQDLALQNGIKYVLVSHNTKMGAASGAVLLAELLAHNGRIG